MSLLVLLDYLWGSFTIVAGIVFYFVVPNNQSEAYFLTPRQQYVAVERLRVDQSGIENTHFKWSQALEAFTVSFINAGVTVNLSN